MERDLADRSEQLKHVNSELQFKMQSCSVCCFKAWKHLEGLSDVWRQRGWLVIVSHLKCLIFSPFSTVCLQAAYPGWPSSAWGVSSSWEPTRRSAVLCYSSTSSSDGQVRSPDLLQELQEKASPGSGTPVPWSPPTMHSNAAGSLKNKGHLVLRERAVRKSDSMTHRSCWSVPCRLNWTDSVASVELHNMSSEASLLLMWVNEWVTVLKTVSSSTLLPFGMPSPALFHDHFSVLSIFSPLH